MKQLQQAFTTFTKVAKQQKKADDIRYRLLTYCIALPLHEGEGYLLYNALSCELLLLSDEEYSHVTQLDYLRNHWFVVPTHFDDRKFAQQLFEVYQLLEDKNKTIRNYTILTTTDCNARCFYCYELGRSRIPMTEATALKVAQYIAANYQQGDASNSVQHGNASNSVQHGNASNSVQHGNAASNQSSSVKAEATPKTTIQKSVSLQWFGGEPLYNNKVIRIICDYLRQRNIPYHSSMVSNAYLFDEALVKEAANDWLLKRIQITLDGTEKVYNRSKNFIYKEGSAFERVMHNIDLLLEAGVSVNIRMNIELYNADDLMALARQLAVTFGGRKGFSCYSHPLFEMAGEKSHERSKERRARVYEKQQHLQHLLDELHIASSHSLKTSIQTHHCMADSGNSVVIAPTGEIGLCEHYSESEFFSHVDTPDQKDTAQIAKFSQRCEDTPLCDDCAYYPHCKRLKMCEEGSVCFEEIKLQRIDKMRRSMLATYQRWLRQQSHNSEEEEAAFSPDEC